MSGAAVTYLFVPATDDRKVAKALESGADAVILDLEDSIPDPLKDAARSHIHDYLSAKLPPTTSEVWVRVNGSEPHFTPDIKAINWGAVTGAVLPKAEGRENIRKLLDAGAKRVMPIVESAAAFKALDQLVASGGVERFALGTWDLAVDLGVVSVKPDDSELIWQLRGQIVLASRQLNLLRPIDGVHAQFSDDEGLRKTSERAYALGFGGKLIIHPRQIATVNTVFRPDGEALRHAHAVIEAYDEAVRQGRGAIQLDGEMIDRPVVERARALLARWK